MGLEDEIRQELWRKASSDPMALEATVSGERVGASTEDVIRMLFTKLNALEQATLRLARELDERAT